MSFYELNLLVGNRIIGLKFPSSGLRDFMVEYFMDNVTEKSADLNLEIEIMNRKTPVEIVPDSLFHAKRGEGENFRVEGGMMEGSYSSGLGIGRIRIHPVMVETMAIRVFEQILYQAYVTAAASSYSLMPLIHSSGVIREGKGYLFLGASEAGKSTVAGLSRSFQIINDEITIADISGNVPMLRSTPYNGTFRDKQAGSAPLAGIFILNKDTKHAVRPAQGGSAVKLIASQIIPPVGLDQFMNSRDYLIQVDIALELSRRIPLYNLHFAKDAGFWDEIEKIME
jgi:hypothetical protein